MEQQKQQGASTPHLHTNNKQCRGRATDPTPAPVEGVVAEDEEATEVAEVVAEATTEVADTVATIAIITIKHSNPS